MSTPRYLTKSRFKLAMDCPTKLFYADKPEYANRKLDDPFLSALADGGYQVGALARCYFPDGIHVESKNYKDALFETNELLKRDNVIIFEAAFCYDLFFIRADIIVKRGPDLELIEVKAKSCDFDDETGCHNQNGTLNSDFKTQIEDVAFQKYVIRNARPELNISAFLMLADKRTLCPTDGLNQRFRLSKDARGNKFMVVSTELTGDDLSSQLLTKINVDKSCDIVYSAIESTDGGSFEQKIAMFADHYARDEKIAPVPSSSCKKCEFRPVEAEVDSTLRDGFRECWTQAFNWQDGDFDEPTVLDIWNSRKKDKLIEQGKIKLSALTVDDLAPKSDKKPGLSQSQRQWLQVEKAQNRDDSLWIDTEGLRQEMATWKFPLHFIDFETSMPVIPFKNGRRPYEGIAFQFSHHTVDENGNVAHCGEYLNAMPGIFPNYDFVRELKAQLEADSGSIFRYHSHENTYLNTVHKQLRNDSGEIRDRDDLLHFIESISQSTGNSEVEWQGERNMIDLCALVKRYYYHPATNGSNSIKHVLPAILNCSEFLKQKYSRPIYGAADGIPSLNFNDWRWVEFDGDKVRDPYKLLPKLFLDESDRDYHILMADIDEIRDGGAALTAYGKLQFQDMSDYERQGIESALLQYCELDTLAMVMIYEAWYAMLRD